MTRIPSMIIRGHSIHVVTEGPPGGPVVLLLHHGLGSVKAWRNTMPVLAAAGFRVIAYDRWGYGKSDFRAGLGQPEFHEDRQDLLALLDELGLTRPAIVGHSDGGTIALYFAVNHPERVAALVTIAAHIYVEPKMDAGIASVKKAFEGDERLLAGLRRIHGDKAGQVFSNWFDGWRQEASLDWDMRPELAEIRCPVLVVQGEDDEHATPQHAIDIANAISGAKLCLVKKGLHMLPQEMPEQFNRWLLDFLGEVP